MFWLTANRCSKMGKDWINRNLLKCISCDEIKLTCPQISSRDTCNTAYGGLHQERLSLNIWFFVQDYLFGYTCCYQLYLFPILSFNHTVQNESHFLPLNSSFHKLRILTIEQGSAFWLLFIYFSPVFHS